MLEDLSRYQNLGTPACHFQLLTLIAQNPSQKWDEKKVRDYFYNKVIDGRSIFDGCLHFLVSIDVIELQADGELITDKAVFSFLENVNLLTERLVELILIKLKNDAIFHTIFCSEQITYDIIHKGILIDNSAFLFKHAGFKQLLLDFEVMYIHPIDEIKKYILNRRYKKLFDKIILPRIREKKTGVEELKALIEERQINGEEAEKFVLKYEKNRLNHTKEIDWVAEYSVSDGYDVASYNTPQSDDHDRFIEVKSYIGRPYFFWSRNEMNVARIKTTNYFLYLVDRSKMDDKEYHPLIIQDPYNNVYNNGNWHQRVENMRFDSARSGGD